LAERYLGVDLMYRYLSTTQEGPVEYLTLNRPDVRNAFNEEVIAELTDWTSGVTPRIGVDGVRAVVLAGAGKFFCAGADISWMAKTAGFTEAENLRDATAAARLFALLDTLPVALIGRIQGAALGGGAGLAAVCDIVVAEEMTVFGFTEVKLGIVPAVIAPFVLAKIGQSAARQLFVTGMRFSAARAYEIDLVHAVVSAAELDSRVQQYVSEVLAAGPEAIAEAKALIRKVAESPIGRAGPLTAQTIAARRASAEGQEGLKAFLEKRKPSWAR
jgi:methylglutaconyl-CoA hydratase